MTTQGWPSEWLRGVLEVCVLQVVGRAPTYGYAIAAALADAGLGQVKGGTLYPLLSRLEAAGHVEVEWRPGDGGPGRKYYRLSATGRDERDRQVGAWLAFTTVTQALVDAGPVAATADQGGDRA